MTEIVISNNPPQISESDYKDLAKELIEELVHGDTSPFREMTDTLETYLDSASDLDSTQKAGIYASFLKDTYISISNQALSNAYQVLTQNTSLELETYKVEADYNATAANIAKTTSDEALVVSKTTTEGKQQDLLDQQLIQSKWTNKEAEAKVKKQYGYGDATADALGDSSNDGALDKQIKGYDLVSWKDMVKTLDERTALFQNAKIPESTETKTFRVALINKILDESNATEINYSRPSSGS